MRNLFVLSIIAAAIALMGFKGQPTNFTPYYGKAPDFTLHTIEGDTVNLKDLQGKAVLLEFWFPGCVGCAEAIPLLNSLHNDYNRDKLKVFAVEYVERYRNSALEAYAKDHKMDYPILQEGSKTAKDYRVFGAPTFILIDQNGYIYYSSMNLDEYKIRKSIENLINSRL